MGTVSYNSRLDRYVGRATVAPGKRKYFYGPLGDKRASAKLGVEEQMRPFLGHRSTDAEKTVGGAIRDFLLTADHLAPKTRSLYETAAKHIIGDPGEESGKRKRKSKAADPISRVALIDLKPTDIRDFYRRLETGDTMKRKVHVLLHRVLEDAVQLEIIHGNPASRVPKHKAQRKEIAVWTPQEVKKFLKAARGHRLEALFVLALTTTMGPAELFGLKRSDVDLARGRVTVQRNLVTVAGRLHEGSTKTGFRRRPIDIPQIAVEALRRRYKIAMKEGHAGSPYVFTSDHGGEIRIENFRRRVWDPLITKAKVSRITPYGMRHTANALMGHIGVPITVAQKRMGHSSIRTTVDVYGHLFESAGKEAAAKLDAFLSEKRTVTSE